MTKRYYNLKEAASYSALSRSTLYAANKLGLLMFTKFGTATRIEHSDLDAYLDSQAEKVIAA